MADHNQCAKENYMKILRGPYVTLQEAKLRGKYNFFHAFR